MRRHQRERVVFQRLLRAEEAYQIGLSAEGEAKWSFSVMPLNEKKERERERKYGRLHVFVSAAFFAVVDWFVKLHSFSW